MSDRDATADIPVVIDVILLMLDEIVAKKTAGQESIGQRNGYKAIARPRRGPHEEAS